MWCVCVRVGERVGEKVGETVAERVGERVCEGRRECWREGWREGGRVGMRDLDFVLTLFSLMILMKFHCLSVLFLLELNILLNFLGRLNNFLEKVENSGLFSSIVQSKLV